MKGEGHAAKRRQSIMGVFSNCSSSNDAGFYGNVTAVDQILGDTKSCLGDAWTLSLIR